MENISCHVAAGKINKDLLHEYLSALLNEDEDNEELKLKIFHAISD
jgi:death on curing protein